MATPKIIVDSRINIPVKYVDSNYIQDKLTFYEYENTICAKCEFRSIRPSDECRSCPYGGMLSITALAKERELKGKEYISIPYGCIHKFEKLTDLELEDCKFIDKTNAPEHTYKVKFKGSLRDYQKKPVADLMDELCGLFIAPPRSGKTVVGTYVACEHGVRTIIMADQKDFLDGFYETIQQMTNLPELEEIHGKKLFGFPKTLEDYENFQIILITYQSLIKDSATSKERLRLLNKHYGCVIVDEVHSANASTFASVLSNVTMKYRYGLTATKDRKDGLQYRIDHILGKKVAEARVAELVPYYTLHKTPKSIQSKAKYTGKGGWVRFNQFLAKHPDRNDYILEWIIKDLEAGRSLSIPVIFTDHAKKLVNDINNHFGYEIAATFLGGAKEAKQRKPIVDAARAGTIRCVIGTRSLLQRGINIPKWDTLYYIMPMNNKPNWKQESCRILTPMEGKRQPLIRMFVDTNMDLSKGCCKSVIKFNEENKYRPAARTPKKMRNWLGSISRGYKDQTGESPDYFEQEERPVIQQRAFRSFK